jgi:hypothetical protein
MPSWFCIGSYARLLANDSRQSMGQNYLRKGKAHWTLSPPEWRPTPRSAVGIRGPFAASSFSMELLVKKVVQTFQKYMIKPCRSTIA